MSKGRGQFSRFHPCPQGQLFHTSRYRAHRLCPVNQTGCRVHSPKWCIWWGPGIALLLLWPQDKLSHLPQEVRWGGRASFTCPLYYMTEEKRQIIPARVVDAGSPIPYIWYLPYQQHQLCYAAQVKSRASSSHHCAGPCFLITKRT